VSDNDRISAVHRGAARAHEALAVRLTARVPLRDLVEAVETARWPQRQREQWFESLAQGASHGARFLGTRPDGRAELEVAGGRLSLRVRNASMLPAKGEVVRLRLAPAAGSARGEVSLEPIAAAVAIRTEDEDTVAELSGAARLIRSLLEGAPGPQAAARAHAPLLDAAAQRADELASGLRRDVVRSGVFYESHLARWIQGDYDLEEIRHEPQARLAERQAASRETASAAPGEKWPPELASAVRRQLDTLELGVLAWRGELWPGCEAGIEIGTEPQASRPGAQALWSARVKLEMPELGTVSALVRLAGPNVSVEIETGDDGARTALAQSGPELAAALDSAGLRTQNVVVGEDGAP
jgi:hypothetical protein